MKADVPPPGPRRPCPSPPHWHSMAPESGAGADLAHRAGI